MSTVFHRRQTSGDLLPVIQCGDYSCNTCLGILLNPTCPNPDDAPSVATQKRKILGIPPPVLLNLRLPEWRETVPPSGKAIAMPEVAIDEHGNPSSIEDYVWGPRDPGVV